MNKQFAQKFFDSSHSETAKRIIGSLLSSLLLASFFLTLTSQTANAAVREKVKEPIVKYRLNKDLYY